MGKSNKSSEPSKMRQKINEMCEENEYLSIAQNRNRARSITVGTAFGGVVEINMRSDIASVYAQLQPIEAIEIIEQLAAGVGIEIAMRPKNDFTSWRGWQEVTGQNVPLSHISWKGAAPFQLADIEEEQKQLAAAEEPAAEEEKPAPKKRRKRVAKKTDE